MVRHKNKAHNLLNIRAIIDDAKCFATVRELRWPDGVRCVHCDSEMVIKHGRDETQPNRQRYHCKTCNRYFDDLTSTIFEGHHQPLEVWILCLYFMGLNLSNCQIAQGLDVNLSDVQQMTHQLRQGVVVRKPQVKLEQEVECDEVYMIAGHKGHPGAVKKRTERSAQSPERGSVAGHAGERETPCLRNDSARWRGSDPDVGERQAENHQAPDSVDDPTWNHRVYGRIRHL